MWMAVIWVSMYGQRTDYVGASLLAKAVCQSPLCWVYRRLREQARSHRDWGVSNDGNSVSIKFSGLGWLAWTPTQRWDSASLVPLWLSRSSHHWHWAWN
ncbi:hypothetical protein D3C71_1733390 [compost metagenome]